MTKTKTILAITLITLGILGALTAILFPWIIQDTINNGKTTLTQAEQTIKKTIAENNDQSGQGWGTQNPDGTWTGLPTITLGGPGGATEVDQCNGTFTHMTEYPDHLQPWYSAHNGCGGNTILPLQTGNQLNITGQGVWEVTEIRNIPQKGSYTNDVEGIWGTIIIQTCYWDDTTMKVMALNYVPTKEEIKAAKQAEKAAAKEANKKEKEQNNKNKETLTPTTEQPTIN